MGLERDVSGCAPVLGCVTAIGCAVQDDETTALEEDEVLCAVEDGPGYEPQTTQGALCRAACAGAWALGCGAVTAACTGATTITIGSTTIPCTIAVLAACTASAVGISLCAESCPQ